MRDGYVLEIPGTPPSLNAYATKRWSYIKEKKAWEGHIMIALNIAKVPRPFRACKVTGTVYFKDKRKRDEGNFRTLLEKAMGDILQKAGYLADDNWDRYEFGKLELGHDKDAPRVELQLEIEV